MRLLLPMLTMLLLLLMLLPLLLLLLPLLLLLLLLLPLWLPFTRVKLVSHSCRHGQPMSTLCW